MSEFAKTLDKAYDTFMTRTDWRGFGSGYALFQFLQHTKKFGLENEKASETYELVTINGYVDQLLPNEDGELDRLGKSWIVVPRVWAEKRAIAQGFDDFGDFLNNYTYDNTIGWTQEAIRQGVLVGAGVGLLP